MKVAQDKIVDLVKEYIRLFPDEYKAFLTSQREKKGGTDKWATIDKSDVLERHLFDLPETLDKGIVRVLNKEERDWLFARGSQRGNFAGLKWFMNRFPAFKITKDF